MAINRRILIVFPLREQVLSLRVTDHVESAARLAAERPDVDKVQITTSPDHTSVVGARNQGVSVALRDGYTHLWFVDDDVLVPKTALCDLIDTGADVAAGCVPIFRNNPVMLNVSYRSHDNRWLWRNYWFDGIEDVERAGTGCMLINLDIFRELGFPYFRMPREIWANTRETEDVDFCRRALRSGYTIRAHGNVQCGHIKEIDLAGLLNLRNAYIEVTTGNQAGQTENGHKGPSVEGILEGQGAAQAP